MIVTVITSLNIDFPAFLYYDEMVLNPEHPKGTLFMNITGIIAEYNPFHNGHACQLTQAREETNADYILIIMSGNFVQRGAPALLDKFTRTKMALLEGADLVIELPALWSTASAEYFADAGIALLSQLGCVSTLCYGCETPSSGIYAKICTILNNETPQYQQLLGHALKTGSGYALARETALLSLLPDSDKAAARELLKNPNNILALEYQKALAREASEIRVHPILRQGQGYHSGLFTDPFASASAIRGYLTNHPADGSQALQQVMPAAAYRTLADYERRYPFLYEDDCSQMLHYSLLKHASDGFSLYADCTPELSNRICRNLNDYSGFSSFCALLKSKDLAYTRISRVLLHILLDIRQSSYVHWRSRAYIPYARILGFRKASQELLTHVKKHSSLPFLTRAADAKKILSAKDDFCFLQKHLFADNVYRALITGRTGRKMRHELQQQIVIL